MFNISQEYRDELNIAAAIIELYENGGKYGLVFMVNIFDKNIRASITRHTQSRSAPDSLFFIESGGSMQMIALTSAACKEYPHSKKIIKKQIWAQRWNKYKSVIQNINPLTKFKRPTIHIVPTILIVGAILALPVAYYALADSPKAKKDFETIKTYFFSEDSPKQ